MSEWKEIKLGELLNVITKGTTPPKGIGFVDKGINYVKSDAIGYDRKLDKTKIAHINEETHQSFKRSQLAENDILFSMAGIYLGKNAIVTKDILPANKNQALAILRLNQEKANPTYVSLYLSQQVMIDYVNNMSGQSAQPNVNFEEIKSIEIKLPPISEQTAIASVLSSLDDKIDLLHRQNATLEKMAETLFRQWFVEEAKEEWVRTKIGNILETVLGGTPSTTKAEYWDGNISWINSGEVNNFRILRGTKFITELGLNKSNTKLLPKGTTVLAITGATLGQVSLLETETCANQSVVGIIPNEILSKEFIFLWVKLKIKEIILSETGGAQPHINKNDINETDIIIPDSEYFKKMKEQIEPLFDKITQNCFQLRILEQLRDSLLPKLMSGEVRVETS